MYACVHPHHTGCWIYLHSVDQLRPEVLQTTCSLLSLLQQARQVGASSFKWVDQTVAISPESSSVCMASISTPLHSPNYTSLPILPSSLASSFKICDVQTPDRNEVTKILFAIQNFDNAASLAVSLTKFCQAYEEIFVAACSCSSPYEFSVTLDLHTLKMIVSLSRKHMSEFDDISTPASADIEPTPAAGEEGLHKTNAVHSEISESTPVSLKERFLINEGMAETCLQKTHHKLCLEELSVVLALKDSILCSVLPGSREHSVVVKLMTDIFPSCDIECLLAHEESVREGLAVKANQDREAGESARESRAASVMQSMQEDHHSTNGQSHTFVSDHILFGLFPHRKDCCARSGLYDVLLTHAFYMYMCTVLHMYMHV